jgi:hypothetical protein
MKKTKLEKELTAHFTNFFAGVITPDIKIRCVFREIMFIRKYKFPGKTVKVVGQPFRIGLTMTIPSNPALPYSDCWLGDFHKSSDADWDIIKKDFETFEKLYHLMKTSKKQILADVNRIAQCNHDELVLKQLQYGWDKRSYRMDGTKPVIIEYKQK